MAGGLITCDTPSEAAFLGLFLAADGERVVSRGQVALEARYQTIVVERPWVLPVEIPGRALAPAIGAIEALQLVGQVAVPEALTDRFKAFDKFVEEGTMWGSYGPRLYSQIGKATLALAADPGTRQAVMTIYDGTRDLCRDDPDIPCTIAVQLMIRSGALEARVMMRSNDAYLGLPYDLTQFIALQATVARALDLPMGPYVHQPGSLHLYMKDFKRATAVTPPPVDDDPKPYRPLWSGKTIGDISTFCRRVLAGQAPPAVTPFEQWLIGSLR